eukprot:2903528-Pleurochrysis_carterae.AAC.1
MYSVAFLPLHNPSDEPVLLLHSTQFCSVTLRPDLGVSQGEFTVIPASDSYTGKGWTGPMRSRQRNRANRIWRGRSEEDRARIGKGWRR